MSWNQYTCNVIYGSTGQRSMFMGMDLSCDMKVAHALGETPVIDKEVSLEKGTYIVSDLLQSNKGLKYDLIIRMMLTDGVLDYDTKVKVGSNGRLREVFLVKEKTAYRIFGKTYHGLFER
jgi:hypothetical protein